MPLLPRYTITTTDGSHILLGNDDAAETAVDSTRTPVYPGGLQQA